MKNYYPSSTHVWSIFVQLIYERKKFRISFFSHILQQLKLSITVSEKKRSTHNKTSGEFVNWSNNRKFPPKILYLPLIRTPTLKSMRRRFIIFDLFLILKIQFFYIRKWFFDIINSNSWSKKITVIFWNEENDFLISENHFLISKIRFLYIKKSFFDMKKYIRFSDIKKYNFLYQKFILLI